MSDPKHGQIIPNENANTFNSRPQISLNLTSTCKGPSSSSFWTSFSAQLADAGAEVARRVLGELVWLELDCVDGEYLTGQRQSFQKGQQPSLQKVHTDQRDDQRDVEPHNPWLAGTSGHCD